MKNEALYEEWRALLKNRKATKEAHSPKSGTGAKASKPYLHLDFSIPDEELDCWQPILLDPDQVRRRAFYPFLKTVQKRKRYAKDAAGIRRPHPEGHKERDICYAAHHDSLFYSWYGFKLEKLLEPQLLALGLDDCVLAYRSKGRNNIQFAKEVFDYIAEQSTCVALAFDVSKFFDTLHHGKLKRAWADLLELPELPKDHYTVFKSMTSFRFLKVDVIEEVLGEAKFKECLRRRRFVYPEQFRSKLLPFQEVNGKVGIPQGAPMSAVLSNLYMLKVDAALQHFAQQQKGIYRRYCDDLLLVVPIGSEVAAEALVRSQLAAIELVMNEKKTERRFFTRNSASSTLVCHDEKNRTIPLQYLGLEYNGKAILLRSSSLSRYHQRMRRSVRKAVYKAREVDLKGNGKVFRRALFRKFTRLGKSNFIKYAEKAYKLTGSETIKSQVKGCVERVNKVIQEEVTRYENRPNRRRQNAFGGTGHMRPVTY